ncbi:hypothetical protein QZH41_004093 [Actinostola sp. cb2023]|nr:hypothetical protein QZH41_004093 [Actinostola sp. cb2023]
MSIIPSVTHNIHKQYITIGYFRIQITDFVHGFIEVLGEIHFVLTVFIGIEICLCHVLLCIDRYDAIKAPFNRRITKIRMKRISQIIWAISLGAGVVTSVLVISVPTHWLTLEEDQPHFIAGEILNSVGTFVILSILFAMLYSSYIVKRAVAAHNDNMVHSLGRATLDREVKITKVAAVLVTGFTTTCLPWVIVRLLYSITGHQDKISYMISYTLLYTSHAINPIIYAGFIKTFQTTMLDSFFMFVSKALCGLPVCVSESRRPEHTSDDNTRIALSLAKVHRRIDVEKHPPSSHINEAVVISS